MLRNHKNLTIINLISAKKLFLANAYIFLLEELVLIFVRILHSIFILAKVKF